MKTFWWVLGIVSLVSFFAIHSGNAATTTPSASYVAPIASYKPEPESKPTTPVDSKNRAWLKEWAPQANVIEHQACLANMGYMQPSGIDGVEGRVTRAATDVVNAKGGLDGLSEEEIDKCWYAVKYVQARAVIVKAEADRQRAVDAAWVGNQPTYSTPTYGGSDSWARTCPGGSCYGQISTVTGNARTTYVRGYTRRDGTYVGAHYRSHR